VTPPALPSAAVALLACPACTSGLRADGTVLRCTRGHAFDRARQGHVTLLPPGHRPPSGDDAGMVADRVAFLGAGHYAGLTRALGDAVLADRPEPRTMLDLGGGTGAHLTGVLERLPDAVGVVVDSSPYAARRAARAHPRAMAVVADGWARLPVSDAVLDRVLVVFAPRGGAEIARVLRPEGRLVVITPEPDHLAELVEPLSLLRVDPAKESRLSAALEPHLEPTRERHHRELLLLDHPSVVALVGMGPHARHRSRAEVATAVSRLPEPVPVTLSVRLGTYRPAPGARPDGVPTARSGGRPDDGLSSGT
jgi:23S rRNA (guanine745-N1)-methyltransferase